MRQPGRVGDGPRAHQVRDARRVQQVRAVRLVRRMAALALLGFAAIGVAAPLAAQTISHEEAMVIKADEDFNRSVVEKDKTAFLALVADNATFNGGARNELKGKDAIWNAWSAYFGENGPTITWHPSKAEVLAGGDVAYTTGFSERRAADGKTSRGNYLTVWRKQPDGRWQVVFDVGSTVPQR